MPNQKGVGHIVLTVTDVNRSAEFYNKLFGTETIVSDKDEIGPLNVTAGPSAMFGFRTHNATDERDAFDPARVGLDHVGFNVASTEDLETWRGRLDELGVENSGIVSDDFGDHLSAKDPDNIAIEFFVPAQS